MPPPRPSSLRPLQIWRTSRQPLFWLDGDLRVSWTNSAFDELTRFPSESLVGTIAHAYGPNAEGDAVELAAALSPPPEVIEGRCATTAAIFVAADGTRNRRCLAFQPFQDQTGALLGVLGRVLGEDESAIGIDGEAESHRLRIRLMDVRASLMERYGIDSLIGAGAGHRRLLEQIRAASTVRGPVLFVGEPGVGKRHAARVVHQLASATSTAEPPLRIFDFEALPAEVLDREMFAPVDLESPASPPRLAAPEGASLLIGDLTALPRDLQAKFALALEAAPARVRILAVTSADPEAAMKAETLRRDLYLALSILTIPLPPLRDRRDDVPLLAQAFLERVNRRGGRQRPGFTRAAEDVLSAYHWPGNLRELARVVEDAHGRGESPLVAEADLPQGIRGSQGDPYPPPRPPRPRPLDEILEDVERRLIESAMVRSRRNKSRASEILGVSRPRLYRRLKELGFPDVDDEG